MEGLEAKTQLLKATFEDLSNNVISSELVGSLLSVANVFLQLANTGVGRLITQIVLLTTVGWGLVQLFRAMGIAEVVVDNFKRLSDAYKAIKYSIKGVITVSDAFNTALSASLPLIGTIITLVTVAISIFSSFGNKVEKLESQLDECTTALESFQAEADELSQKAELTPAEEARLAYLYAMIEAEKTLQEETAKRLYQEKYSKDTAYTETTVPNLTGVATSDIARNVVTTTTILPKDEYLLQQLNTLKDTQDQIQSLTNEINNLDQHSDSYNDTVISLTDEQSALQDSYNTLLEEILPDVKDLIDLSEDMAEEDVPDIVNSIIEAFTELYPAAEDAAQGASDLGDDLSETATEAVSLSDSLKGLSSAYDTLASAVEEYNTNGAISFDTLAALIELGDDYLSMLSLENGRLVLNQNALYNKAEQIRQAAIEEAKATAASRIYAVVTGELNESISNTGDAGSDATSGLNQYINKLDEVTSGALTASAAATVLAGSLNFDYGAALDPSALPAGFENLSPGKQQQLIEMGWGSTSGYSSKKNQIQSIIEDYQDMIDIINSSTLTLAGGTSGGGGGSAVQDALELQQDIINENVKNMEHEIFLLEKQGASYETLISKYKALQDYIQQQADWYRSQGLDENSQYIQDLQKQWWDYADEIESIYEQIEEDWEENRQATLDWLQEDIDAYETLFSAVSDRAQDEIDALQAQKDLLQAQNDELNEQIELEETLDALARARQTKVLVYKDGRYQYVEDIDEVSSAQSDLEKLRQEQELQDRLDAIDKEIEYWEDYKDAWSSVVDNYETEQNKLLLSQKFGITLEGENWQLRLGNLAQYVNEYNGLMDSLKSFENMTFGGSTGKPSGVDWSQIWWDAENDTSLSEEKRTQIQNWAHAQKADELKGTGAKFDAPSGTWYYAGGTTSAQGGMSLVGEEGAELRILNKGDGILPADITRNLWSWGTTTPAQMMSNIINTAGQSKSYNISISNLNLPEVKDGPSFVEYMKNNIWRKAIQLTV